MWRYSDLSHVTSLKIVEWSVSSWSWISEKSGFFLNSSHIFKVKITTRLELNLTQTSDCYLIDTWLFFGLKKCKSPVEPKTVRLWWHLRYLDMQNHGTFTYAGTCTSINLLFTCTFDILTDRLSKFSQAKELEASSNPKGNWDFWRPTWGPAYRFIPTRVHINIHVLHKFSTNEKNTTLYCQVFKTYRKFS